LKTEEQYFQEGQSIDVYMDNMSKLKDESFLVYEQFQLPSDDFIDQLKQASVHFLIITEDWCGDAMMNNAIIRKVAEAAHKDVRVVLRDSNLDLMDRHLTNGSRSIPIVLMLNEDGELIGKWGPRAPKCQQLIDDSRAQLPEKDDPSFEEKQRDMYKGITKQFSSNEELWNNVYASFKEAVLEAVK